jgi:hypothetical protein
VSPFCDPLLYACKDTYIDYKSVFYMARTMAQAVSRRPATVEVRVRSRVSPCRIFSGQSSTGTGFFFQYLGFPLFVFIARVLHYTEKQEKLIIFIRGFHSKLQGCGASVPSAAVPLTTKYFFRVSLLHISALMQGTVVNFRRDISVALFKLLYFVI